MTRPTKYITSLVFEREIEEHELWWKGGFAWETGKEDNMIGLWDEKNKIFYQEVWVEQTSWFSTLFCCLILWFRWVTLKVAFVILKRRKS